MDFASISLPGPKGTNDDRTLLPLLVDAGWVAGIADGVGGNAGGYIAAELALDTVRGEAEVGRLQLTSVIDDICQRMATYVSEHPDLARMATTLSVVRWDAEQKAEIAHVGDTRVYHIRGSGIVTRTKDQTEVAELLEQNILTPSQARRYPRRNVLMSYVSAAGQHRVYRSKFDVRSGDWIILATDGAYGKIRKTEFIDLASKSRTASDFVSSAKQKLLSSTLDDDSSLVAVLIS